MDNGPCAQGAGRRAVHGQGLEGCFATVLVEFVDDAIEQHGFDSAFGGARRDEEKARAKERIFSFRDEFGQWNPKAQRPELWDLYNTRVAPGESVRAAMQDLERDDRRILQFPLVRRRRIQSASG